MFEIIIIIIKIATRKYKVKKIQNKRYIINKRKLF